VRSPLLASSCLWVLVCSQLNGCGQTPFESDVIYNSASAKANFRLRSSLTALENSTVDPTLWNGFGNFLQIDSEKRIKYKNMVMVSFNPSSSLVDDLLKDERTLIYKKPSSQTPGLALLELDDLSELQELAQKAHGGPGLACGNVDLLNLAQPLHLAAGKLWPAVYDESMNLSEVEFLISEADKAGLASHVEELEDLGTRFHSSATGISVTAAIAAMVETAADDSIGGILYEQVTHTSTAQKSLVVRIPGPNPEAPRVILGAHMDSINHDSGGDEYAPGADDDATGVATLLEVIRIIAKSGATFSRPLEFHFYAAEEVGLIGSKAIAASYESDETPVAAMFQLDMNGFSSDKNSRTIYLVSNETSSNLRRSLKNLLVTYLGGDFEEKALSSGTSDHRSWTNQGYAAVFPFEDPSDYNEHIHTSKDTTAELSKRGLDFSLSERFAQLSLAFVSHYAGLESAASEYERDFKQTSGGDLALAVIDADAPNKYNFAVGTSTETKHATICPMTNENASGCDGELLELALLGEKNQRNILYSEVDSVVGSGTWYRIAGYNGDDAPLGVRVVRLEKK
jgi:leucyl aminopeptidase